jgi:hypothetical protein
VLFSFISLKYIELFERILTAGKLRELRDGTRAGRDGTETLRERDGRESKFSKFGALVTALIAFVTQNVSLLVLMLCLLLYKELFNK